MRQSAGADFVDCRSDAAAKRTRGEPLPGRCHFLAQVLFSIGAYKKPLFSVFINTWEEYHVWLLAGTAGVHHPLNIAPVIRYGVLSAESK